MSEGKRPGGLTALAVLNFVFGGLGLLVCLGLLAVFGLVNAVEEDVPELGDTSQSMLALYLLLSLVSTGLLIASGVGYLKLKRFLGRKLGNAYALLSIITSVVSLVTMSEGFNLGTLIGFIYPVLTLVLLNTTFKEDFVH